MGSSLAFRNFLLRFLFLACAVSGCVAGVGFQPVSPDELHMTSEPEAPGAPAIILFHEVDRDDNPHTGHEDNYLRIKILTEEGRKYADVEIPFYREREDNIVNIRARTIRPDGTIANFDGKIFDKAIVKGKGVKYMAKTFTLPDVQVGSIIEYFYTNDFTEHYIYNTHWILSDELFTKVGRFTLKPFESDYDRFFLRWSWNWLPAGSAQPQQGPDQIVRLEVHNVPAFQSEDHMPPEVELKSRIDFIYSREAFEPDVNKFWNKVGKRLNGSVEGFVGKPKAMQAAVGQMVSPSDTPEIKLQKIYARVQQMRNTSFEVRKTEQEEKREKEKRAPNAEDIWKQGYGNGGQLTWLYLALVRAAGFDASGVMVSDRSNYFFNPKLMDDSRLDANVVLVKADGKEFYCDPGAKFTPFGLLPWGETNVQGLRLDKDGGSWIQTPVPPSSMSRVERKAILKLSPETGGLEGKLTLTYTGLEAVERRVEERNEDETDRKKFLEEEVKDYIPAAIEVDLTNKPDWGSVETPLVAEFDLKVPGWVAAAGHRALLPVELFGASEKHVFDHANRVHPIYLAFPSQKLDDVTIDLPAGWQVSTVPTPQTQDGHIVLYDLRVENKNNQLHVTRKLDLNFLLIDQKYYAALRSFFQAVKTGDEAEAVLQPGVTVSNK